MDLPRVYGKKVGDFNKNESESLDFTGLKISRDYVIGQEEKIYVIEVNDVVKKCKDMTVLDHADLKVERGTMCGLVGATASEKQF